jgi:oligoribonuclease NrnB/cAMP/cGMP phosphodiesterase (DHH superfamily)
MGNRIVVYHDKCHDGITALWVAKQCWPEAEPYAGNYDVPPDLDKLRGADVVIVDFSWKRAALLSVKEVAASLRIIDHHKTSQAELAGIDGCTFDMERSGAGLAWDLLIGGKRPPLIGYVEDRDLWRFRLPECREVHAACNSYPLTLEARDTLMQRDATELATEGRAILRYHDKLVEAAAKLATTMEIGGHTVPALACPVIEMTSDLGHALAKGAPFAVIYTDRPNGSRLHSLRSADDGMDVSEIAKAFGGGGHKHAAGFTTAPARSAPMADT